MENTKVKVIQTHIAKFEIFHNNRSALITFVNCEFENCKFKLLSQDYSIEDWEFLKIVSEKILELDKGYEGNRFLNRLNKKIESKEIEV